MFLWLIRSAMVDIFPPTDAFPGIAECDLDGFLRRFKRETSRLIWWGVVLGAIAFHVTPLFTVHVPLPAFLLPARLRDRHADRILGSDLYLVRQIVFMLKLMGGLCWGVNPEVRRRMGLPPLAPDPGTWRTT